MAFLLPNNFAPPANSFYGRMWIWVTAFPTAPSYAHFTMVEASGSGNGSLIRPIGGQYIPGQGNGAALWGVGSDGGPTGDWLNWQVADPTVSGAWTCMEWQMQSSNNSVAVWINGVAKPEMGVSTQSHGGANVNLVFPTFNQIKIGWQLYQGGSTPAQFDLWLDDIALATSRLGCGPGTPAPAPAPAPSSSSSLSWRGTALSGAEFGQNNLPGTYNTDYTYPTPSEASYFKGKGMNTVRLPFLWERLQPTLNSAFDPNELSRLTSFVQQVTANGTTVLLDPHNYARYRGNLIGSTQVPNSAFADFWSRLATQFAGNSRVMFGLMNEPHDMPTEQWLAAANAALAAIRATGATNTVTVPGNAWTGAFSWLSNSYGTPNGTVMTGIVDPGKNMVFEVHQYLDSDSSGTSPTCVSSTIGSQRLQAFTGWARANGYRALLGELAGASNATCNLAVTDMLNYVQANTDVWAGWTWWSAGPWWGNYMFSLEPSGSTDKPQMAILQPFLQ